MAFDIKRWPASEKTVKFAAIIVSFIAISVILYTIVVLVPPIKNSIEIQNGTFNYAYSATELQTAISAGNLLSSIVVAGVTVIYVVFTYFILDATNKNTQQSSLSIQQTAKFQKIAHIEHQLEKFYMPVSNLLLRNKTKLLESHINHFLVEWEFENSFKTKPDDINKVERDLYYFITGLKNNFEKEYHSLTSVEYLKIKDSRMSLFDTYEVIVEIYMKVLEALKSHKAGSQLIFADKCDSEKYKEMQAKLAAEITILEKQLEYLLNI